MPKAILLVAFDFSNAHVDEFHDWYDLEHLPERQGIPGFGLCERWISVANPRHAVATYDLDSPDVLASAAYRAIAGDNLSPWSKRLSSLCTRLLRIEGTQTLPGNADSPAQSGGLLINAMNVAPEHEAEFNEWYDHEHIPALSAVPGVLSARRFRDDKGPHRHLALYHLRDSNVATGDAWKTAASSDWTNRLRPFFRDHVRILSRRYVRGEELGGST